MQKRIETVGYGQVDESSEAAAGTQNRKSLFVKYAVIFKISVARFDRIALALLVIATIMAAGAKAQNQQKSVSEHVNLNVPHADPNWSPRAENPFSGIKEIHEILIPAARPFGGCPPVQIPMNQTIPGFIATSDCIHTNTEPPNPMFYYDLYSFFGVAGQQVSITMDASGFVPYIWFYGGIDAVHSSDLDSDFSARVPDEGDLQLPTTGTYYVQAFGRRAIGSGQPNTGNYTLTVNSTFPIYGRVTDGNTNIGVPGVIMSVSDADEFVNGGLPSAVTDGNGYYLIPGLVDGVYFVTPFQPGRTFDPDELRVNINGVAPSPTPADFRRENLTPSIVSLAPAETTQDLPLTITITGENFTPETSVLFGSSTLVPTSISPTSLQVTLLPDNVAAAGTFEVRVINPPPGGGASNSLPFVVNPPPSCPSTPIQIGSSVAGSLTGGSCRTSGAYVEQYSFEVNGSEDIAATLSTTGTSGFTPYLELIGPNGVIETSPSGANVRIPAAEYRTLPTGTYIVRVASYSSLGSFIMTLSRRPANPCSYSLSPTNTNVSPGGGTFSFDVIAGDDCPALTASPGPNSGHIQIVSNTGGRVTFRLGPNDSANEKLGSIVVNAQPQLTHSIRQFGGTPPANDAFSQAQQLVSDPGSNPSAIAAEVLANNANASGPEPGEPLHAGSTASHSIWYKWIAPNGGKFTFTTSGSDFDTVLAIYRCNGSCALNSLVATASNDDTTSFDTTSKINFIATEGTEYRIAIDGKNGASGNIRLQYNQFRRLFRLYLQNFNGFASTFSPPPNGVSARREDGTGATEYGRQISLGVWEFDLPEDNSRYVATISGPDGITWEPSTYTIDNTSASSNALMTGNGTAGQNQVSNATNTVPRKFYGFIHGISTQPELSALRVSIAQTGTSSAAAPRACRDYALTTGGPNGSMRATYTCITQPGSTHEVVPSAPAKSFVASALRLPVLNTDMVASIDYTIIANSLPTTAKISGTVTNGGDPLIGAKIELIRSDIVIDQLESAAPNGGYAFANLAPGTYKVRASLPGYVLSQPANVTLQSTDAVRDITAQGCRYQFSGNGNFPNGRSQGDVSVGATTSPTCAWTAIRGPNSDWININFGSSVGDGRIQFSMDANSGGPRTGSIVVGTDSFSVTQAGGGTTQPVALVVNNANDTNDASPGNGTCADAQGSCTLRGAVQEANAQPGDNVISFDPNIKLISLSLGTEIVIQSSGTLKINSPAAYALSIDGGAGSNRLFRSDGATITISGLTLKGGNGGGSNGGAVLANAGSMTLDRVYIKENSSTQNGGGVSFIGGTHRISNSTIASNTSDGFCGGIHNSQATLVIINTTITGNSAGAGGVGEGGGVCNDGTLQIRHSTITKNSSRGVWQLGGTTNIANTIVSGNFSPGQSGLEVLFSGGGFTSAGGNLIGDAVGDSTNTGSSIAFLATDKQNVDPLLGELNLYGGGTPTHSISPGSPAINSGVVTDIQFSDQRGFPRVSGEAADIGAFELAGTAYDFDGDHIADPSYFRPSENTWYFSRSTTGFFSKPWGAADDLPSPADFNGDGRVDAAVFRPSSGFWYWSDLMTDSYNGIQWGASGDIPVPADHDGDGKADLVVFRPTNGIWYRRLSRDNALSFVEFGVQGDKPQIGDFDGDGKADLAVYRPSDHKWYINKSTEGFSSQTWGIDGDIPVPADYDGDGRTDVAVYRPSTFQWFIVMSRTISIETYSWGAPLDKPAPADFDGDGKVDIAIFRPSTGNWHFIGSTVGIRQITFGSSIDLPTPGLYFR